MERKHFFRGFEFENNFKNFAMLNVNIIFKKYIWACRNGKILPLGESCLHYIIKKIRFFSAFPPIFVREGKIPELTLLFNNTFTILHRQDTQTLLKKFLFLVTCFVCLLSVVLWGPPPLPPLLPLAASAHPASHYRWRLQKGQDYWERAFKSLREDNRPIT